MTERTTFELPHNGDEPEHFLSEVYRCMEPFMTTLEEEHYRLGTVGIQEHPALAKYWALREQGVVTMRAMADAIIQTGELQSGDTGRKYTSEIRRLLWKFVSTQLEVRVTAFQVYCSAFLGEPRMCDDDSFWIPAKDILGLCKLVSKCYDQGWHDEEPASQELVAA
jgi:hypothetical protein